MVEKVSEYIVNNILLSGDHLDENHKEIMVFGVTRILEDVPKLVSIFFACYLLNILLELIIVIIVTILYKPFIGGAHARTNIECFVASCVFFILPIMTAKYLEYSLNLFYIILTLVMLFSIYVIVKIAPADTDEIPIINKNKRKLLKRLGVVSLIFISTFTLLFIRNTVHARIVVYTIFLIDLFATKMMYKLFNCKLGVESEEFSKFYD